MNERGRERENNTAFGNVSPTTTPIYTYILTWVCGALSMGVYMGVVVAFLLVTLVYGLKV